MTRWKTPAKYYTSGPPPAAAHQHCWHETERYDRTTGYVTFMVECCHERCYEAKVRESV